MIFAIDLDDTLINSKDLWEEVALELFGKYGLKRGEFWESRKKLHDFIYSSIEHYKIIFKEKNIPMEFLNQKVGETPNCLQKHADRFIFPDTLWFLGELKKMGHRIILTTFGKQTLQSAKLGNGGLRWFFDDIIISEKPKRDILAGIQKKFPGEQVVFLDDHPHQVDSVKKMLRDIITVRIRHAKGRYSHKASAQKHEEVKNLKEALTATRKFRDVRKINIKIISQEQMIRLCGALASGRVIMFPTDTVYGLGCDASNKKAKEKIYRIKKRPAHKQSSVLMSNLAMVKKYCVVSANAEKFLKKTWPGPVSVVLKVKKTKAAREVFDNQKTALARIPKLKYLREMSSMLQKPIVATSANISGKKQPKNLKDILRQFEKTAPDIVLDAGILPSKKPSTILDLTEFPKIKVLRNGVRAHHFKL